MNTQNGSFIVGLMILSIIAAGGFIYMVAVRGETEHWVGAVGTSFAACIAIARYFFWRYSRVSKRSDDA